MDIKLISAKRTGVTGSTGLQIEKAFNENILALVDIKLKDINSNYIIKDFCVSNEAAPSGASVNDCYFFIGVDSSSDNSTIFGVSGVNRKDVLLLTSGGWTKISLNITISEISTAVALSLNNVSNPSRISYNSLLNLPILQSLSASDIVTMLSTLSGNNRLNYNYISNTPILSSSENGFYVADTLGNVAIKYDTDGLDVAKLSTHFMTLLPINNPISKWRLKSIAYLGDSITEFAIHVNKYSSLTGSVAMNYGVGGTRIASLNSGDTTSFVERYVLMSNAADMVIVFGGTNDFGTGTATFGVFSDRVKTTFYGAMHLLCQGLLAKYPKKPIVFMTPLHRASELNPDFTPSTNGTTGKTLKEYVNAIIEVCNFYSIPVMDSYRNSGIDAITNVNNYFSDGLHPNTIGGYKLASYMYDELEHMYDEYYVNNK